MRKLTRMAFILMAAGIFVDGMSGIYGAGWLTAIARLLFFASLTDMIVSLGFSLRAHRESEREHREDLASLRARDAGSVPAGVREDGTALWLAEAYPASRPYVVVPDEMAMLMAASRKDGQVDYLALAIAAGWLGRKEHGLMPPFIPESLAPPVRRQGAVR